MVPLGNSGYIDPVNLKLTDREIALVCRELIARDPATTRRAIEKALKRRYGSSGRTDRVCRIWRSIREKSAAPPGAPTSRILELEARLQDATVAREAAERRAMLSAERELAFQNRWANELHDLRNEVQRLSGEAVRRAEFEARVLELSRENATLKSRLAGR